MLIWIKCSIQVIDMDKEHSGWCLGSCLLPHIKTWSSKDFGLVCVCYKCNIKVNIYDFEVVFFFAYLAFRIHELISVVLFSDSHIQTMDKFHQTNIHMCIDKIYKVLISSKFNILDYNYRLYIEIRLADSLRFSPNLPPWYRF